MPIINYFLEKTAKAIFKKLQITHTHSLVEAYAYLGIKRLKSSQKSISYPTESAKS